MATTAWRHAGTRGRWLAGLGVLLTAVGAEPGIAAGRYCTGDCGGDGTVTVDEILVLVNVAIGAAPPSACPGVGETVEIDTIVAAVGDALTGCDAAPGITVGTVSAAAGTTAHIVVSLDAAFSQPVFLTQNTIALPEELALEGECLATDGLRGVFTVFSGPECPASRCVRGLVVGAGGSDRPIPAGGPLYACQVRIATSTAAGRLPVNCAEETTVVVAPGGVPTSMAAVCRGGAVTVAP